MESKHTKGKIAIEKTERTNWIGTYRENGKVGDIICDVDREGLIGKAIDNSDANAQLIADAFNVTNETGLTPRELQKSHAELLEALYSLIIAREEGLIMINAIEEINVTSLIEEANQAIKNAKP